MSQTKRTRRTKLQIQLDKLRELKEQGFAVKEAQIGFLQTQVWVEQNVHSNLMCNTCKQKIAMHLPGVLTCCGKLMKVTWKNPSWRVDWDEQQVS